MGDKDNFLKTKLKDLCLKCITENFDRFMSAHQAGNVPAKNFEFLQRAYSKDLYGKLASTEHFLKYSDFLLNPYLKEVNLDLCHSLSDTRIIIEQLKTIGHTITQLILSGYHYNADLLLELTCLLPKVKSLTFNNTYVTDNVLINIGKFCVALETLNLASNSDFTDAGINSLCLTKESDRSIRKNKVLKHLYLGDTSVTAVGIAFVLKHFPNIVTIEHDSVLTAIYNIHSDDIKNNSLELFEKYKLQQLEIQHEDRFMDVNFFKMCPLLCPNVTKLTIMSITSQAQIDACVGFTELKEVYFVSTFQSAKLSFFVEARGSTLEILRIKDGNISAESLLKFCPKLKKLILENTRFEPVKGLKNGDALEPKFQKLKLLSLDAMEFEPEHVLKSVHLILSSSPKLKTLNFIYADSLTLKFIDAIVEHDCMRTLQEIDVSFSDIRCPALKKLLLAAPNLSVFMMQHCDLAFDEYASLQELRPAVRIDWRSDSSEFSDYDAFDRYDDLFDNDYDYFDYDSDNDYIDGFYTYDDDPDVYI